MKHILFTITNMNIGGTEKSLLNLLNTLSPDEYKVTILMLEQKGGFLDMIPSWVQVQELESYDQIRSMIMDPPLAIAKSKFKNLQLLEAIGLCYHHLKFKLTGNRCSYYRYVLRNTPELESDYDIAVAYAGPFDFLSVYLLEKVRAKEKIQWIHFDVSKFFVSPAVMHECYPQFDRIYAVSDEARNSLIDLVPEIKDKTFTRYNVVSRELCWQQAGDLPSYEDDFSGIRILTVGRLSSEKGQDIIPQIANYLKSKNTLFRWYLIGDGKLKDRIKEAIEDNGLHDDIIFLGTKTNPYPYYRDADLYVQTSVHEGFCITLGEAIAFDLPIVSTDFAGAQEQLTGREMSRIVNRDAEDLQNAIVDMIECIQVKRRLKDIEK